jgi:hypothetical protein
MKASDATVGQVVYLDTAVPEVQAALDTHPNLGGERLEVTEIREAYDELLVNDYLVLPARWATQEQS